MALRHDRKLVFIDISMPRNIDPEISRIENTLLFHIDDLDKVVGDNMKKREAAVYLVEKIVSNKVAEFFAKIKKLKTDASSDYFDAVKT